METKNSEDWGKPQRKSESSSRKSNHGPAEMRPALPPENREAPETGEETQNEEPRRLIPIQRHSLFNRAVRHRHKARSTSERRASDQADLPKMGKSVNERSAFNLPQGRLPPWRTPAQRDTGAQEASESSSTPGNGTTPEECPALTDSPTTLTEALQMIHPIPADSWRNLIEQIGLLYQEYRDKSTLQEIETRRQQDAEIQGNSDGSQVGEDAGEEVLSGRGRWWSSTMSLQYGAEETPLAGSYGAADSFPKDFGYGVEEEEEEAAAGGGGGAGAGGGCGPGGADSSKPRILLMGLRRSGKSSIQKVVFHKMSPNETLFLESTNKIYKDDISNSSFVNFQIWDFPGQMDFFDPTFDYEMIFRGTGALIYVIDAQDDYMEALTRLHITVSKAYKVNPDMNFEVFIHKVDGLSDDHKIETQRDIHQRANDDLADAGLEKLHLSFYLTSIYDHSIFEAFSKVVQKLIPQLPTLENLLNIFISNSGIEKAFLFDVVSKIYIATDSSPVDMQSYELCCDMIDVVIDVSCIYGLKEDGSGSAYDKESMAIIKLNNTTVLYLKEVTKFLALVCILREESFERKGLIDYNFHCFRKAIHEVFEVGVTSHRSCSHQTSAPSLKALAHNGTPRNAI